MNIFAAPPPDPADESAQAPPKFHLTYSNQVYIVLVAACYIGAAYFKGKLDSGSIGYTLGMILGSVLFPAVCGWLAFRVGRRSVDAGSIIFNAVLTLVFAGQVLNFVQERLPKTARLGAEELTQLEENQRDLKRKLSETEDQAEAKALADEYAKKAEDYFLRMSTASGDELERQYYKLIAERVARQGAVRSEWQASIVAVVDAKVFDFTTLPDVAESERRIELAEKYVDLSKRLKEIALDRTELTKKFAALNDPQGKAKRFLEGFFQGQHAELAHFSPFLDEHIRYGEIIIELSELFRENPDAVELRSDGRIAFEKPGVAARFNLLMEQAVECEGAMEVLSKKLLEVK